MNNHLRALIIVTSVEKYPNFSRATGLWLGEAVHFYEKMVAEGIQVDIASPRGGYTPLDPESLKEEAMSEIDWKFYGDESFRAKLGSTLKLSTLKGSDYDVVYLAGGHGVVWDFKDNKELHRICAEAWQGSKIVASVCHGAVGLIDLKDSQGNLIVKGRKVSSFTDEEEKLLGLHIFVPFLTETELTKQGALFSKADPFKPFAVADGKLVTGQNPMSTQLVADLVIKELKQ